jgi:hypothetical protein
MQYTASVSEAEIAQEKKRAFLHAAGTFMHSQPQGDDENSTDGKN